MKTFLYLLTSLRNANKDGVIVVGGRRYYHNQLLAVVEASDVETAAQALNTKVLRSFDRSNVNCPTIYYTSNHETENQAEGYFYLSLKEIEPNDEKEFPDLKEKIRLKITAPTK